MKNGSVPFDRRNPDHMAALKDFAEGVLNPADYDGEPVGFLIAGCSGSDGKPYRLAMDEIEARFTTVELNLSLPLQLNQGADGAL